MANETKRRRVEWHVHNKVVQENKELKDANAAQENSIKSEYYKNKALSCSRDFLESENENLKKRNDNLESQVNTLNPIFASHEKARNLAFVYQGLSIILAVSLGLVLIFLL